MDKIIDKNFQGVEIALSKLTNSIAIYNPTPNLAADLVTADAELSKGLEQLSTHQSNHQKIVALRAASAALDTQIKETLTLLTTTRRALLETSSTTLPASTNPVSYAELLSYARRISKFTLPATYREPGTPTEETPTPKDPKSEPQTNGNGTPEAPLIIMNTNGASTDVQMSGMASLLVSTPPANGNTALPEDFTRYLNPSAEMPFIPWPGQDAIRGGVLANIQRIEDEGKDITDERTWDVQREREEAERLRGEEEERKIVEEGERAERERERLVRVGEERRMVREKAAAEVAAGAAGQESEGDKAKFSLSLFDDDD